jgi:hypothetical protein
MATTNPTSDTVTAVSADPFAILFFVGVGIYCLARLLSFYKLYRAHTRKSRTQEPAPLLGVVYPNKDVH